MAPAGPWAGDYGPGLADVLSCLGDMLGQAHRAAGAMSSSQAPGMRRGSRHSGPAGQRGPRQWGGGFGGSSNLWWPGQPGQPGPERGGKAGRGDVRAAILAVLADGKRNGYQIMSEVEQRSGGAWRPSPGAVYPALSQLADEGLITGAESGGRRTFSLTDAGRAYVQQNPGMARGAWESTAQQEAWQLPGLFTVAASLGGGIVQVARAGTPEQIRAAEHLLKQTRRRLYQILAEDTSAEDTSAEDTGAEDTSGEQDEQ